MKNIIEKFYSAFATLNAEKMVSCYHSEVEFSDPAFGILEGERAKNMWRMLISSQKGKEFLVTYSDISELTAKWEATYIFSKTNRRIHNKILAEFEFKDGLIIKHKDRFSSRKFQRSIFLVFNSINVNLLYFSSTNHNPNH